MHDMVIPATAQDAGSEIAQGLRNICATNYDCCEGVWWRVEGFLERNVEDV